MTDSTLVIGGSYFVGRSIVLGLLRAGQHVTLLNRGTRPIDGTDQLVADRSDPEALRAAVGERRFGWVIDSSCYTAHEARLAFDALSGRCEGWIQIGSAAVYVDDAPVPAPEDGYLGASEQWGDYGLGKLEAERALGDAARPAALPAVVLRAPYIYGPGNEAPRESWLWPRLLRGRPILIPGEGATPLQFLHTQDLFEVVSRFMQEWRRPGLSVFNVASPDAVTIRDYVEALARVAGVEARIREVAYRELEMTPRSFFPFRDTSCVLDVSRLREALDCCARLDLDAGLAETLRSYDRDALASEPIDTQVEDEILARMAAR